MFEPVWFGNYVLPRCEALAIAASTIVGVTILAFVAVLATCWMVLSIGKMWRAHGLR